MTADESGRGTPRGADLRIGHFYADVGVESEALSAYGDVHRFGLDPEPTPFTTETYAVDLSAEVPDVEPFDFGLFHPPCYKWTQRNDEDAENLIPRTREVAADLCREYAIENKPAAPLQAPPGGDLVTFHGSMFGLPVAYERAVETSYEVSTPSRRSNWEREHRVENTRPRQYWKAVKGYTGDYPAQDFITNALPAPYVHCLLRPLLDGYEGQPTSQSQLTEVADVRE